MVHREQFLALPQAGNKESLASRTALADVFRHHVLPLVLCLQDEFDRVTQGAVTAAMLGHIMSIPLHFIASVGDCDSQAAIPHYRQIDDVIADKTRFGCS